jgi:hypothetical protein
MLSVYSYPPIDFWMPEPIFMKLGLYRGTRTYLNGVLYKSFPTVYVSVDVSPIVATQRTIELLYALFSMRSFSYQIT